MEKFAQHSLAAWRPAAIGLVIVGTMLAGVAAAGPLRSEVFVGGLTRPVAFVQDPSHPHQQFVVEQGGRIRVIQNGVLLPAPFLDLTASVASAGEQGLLGLAFAPDYATSGRFFVYFTRADGDLVVARFTRAAADPLVADPASRFDLMWSTGLRHLEHSAYGNHNGGNLAFGPDGYLYIGTGDGGGSGDPQNNAQSASSLLGKMLRVDVNVPDSDPEGFDIPADNPFLAGIPIDARPEIWAVGLRNPWRWSFDDPGRGGTGALIVGDVGQNGREEIDYEPANRGGRNYGWSVREGSTAFPAGGALGVPAYSPLTDPIFEADSRVSTSLIGGFIYRGTRLGAAYLGRYFFADFPSGRVYSLALDIAGDGEATASDFTDHTPELGEVGNLSAFGVDADGELYLVSWASGEILRVLTDAGAPPASTLVSPSGTIGTVRPTYTWNAVGTSEWYYLWVTDQHGVRIQQWYTAAQAGCASGTGVCSATPSVAVTPGEVFWWIQTWNADGYGPWSELLSFTASAPAEVTTVSPTGTSRSTPSFTWNASPLATDYYLWITDSSGTPALQKWYTAAAAGCASGTGTCTVVRPIALRAGTAAWWIQPWNDVGYGPWSAVRYFAVEPLPAATLVSPTGTIETTLPTYTWNAVPSATWYYLWVNGAGEPGRIQAWYTAAAAGCAGGTGTCSITPGISLPSGAAMWWIQTWNEDGYGLWSDPLPFSVNPGIAFTSTPSATFTVGAAGTFSVTTSATPAVTSITLGGVALPGGMTFVDNADGTATLGGTPAAGTAGTYALTFTATNGVGAPAVQNFTLLVHQAPAITSAAATTFPLGAPGTFTVTTTGFPVPAITIGGATLPAGVTFVDNGTGTGTLSGTPAAGTAGSYAITFTAANGVAPQAVQAFTLTVNDGPAITSAASTTFTVGSAGTFTVTTVGAPTPALSATGALPVGVTFVDNGNGTATLSGTPGAGTGGAYPITFTASNGVGTNAVQAFTLNIQEAPAITSANTDTFIVGTADSFTVTATGFPVPTVTHTSGTLPTGVTFTSGTRLLAGTAAQTGAFPLVFTAANGVGADAAQNFTLNVVCPAISVTPTTMPDGLFLTAYAGVDFNQTGSTGSSLTWGATGLPAGLSIDPGTGVVSGTPTNTALNAAVTITVTDTFSCVGTLNTTITVRPTTDNETYTGGVGNTQFVVAAAGVATPHVLVNDNVKTGDSGPGALTVTFPATSPNGAIVEAAVDGTFIYTPNLNFAGPSDSFAYTLTDGNGVTNTGTVTINLSNLVWYVNSSAGAGDGRSQNPFNTLTAAGTASGPGSVIYVHTGGATTSGNLTMDANQTLHGQGATFSLGGLVIPSGARPTLSGSVTLANQDVVTAVNFSGAAPALLASGVTQPVTIDQVNVTGGTTALSLTNVSGAVTVTNTNFTNTTGAEVLISQGTGAVNIAATISSNAGRSIDIQNRTGGTVSFTGAVTDTGQGIFLNANAGSTISFTGGLSLSTGGNPGFTATGGGTVSATQNNTTIVNTITTTTGTALNVANTTIGASGLTFRSISANGGSKGIILNATGSGAFTVSGTGPAGSGGTIQNAISRGAEFIAVNSVTLTDMAFSNNGIGGAVGQCGNALGATVTPTFVTDAGCLSNVHLQTVTTVLLDGVTASDSDGHGINGYQVGTLTLSGVSVERNGNEVGEDGVQLVNSGGTVTVNGANTFRDNASNQFEAQNGSGTATFNISGSFFGLTNFPTTGAAEAPSPGADTANSGLLISASGTASMTATVTGSTFDENYANGYLSDTAGNSSMNITVGTAASGNTFSNNGVPIEIVNSATGSMTYVIRNNTISNDTAITGAFATTAIVGTRSSDAGMTGTIDGNTIGTPGVANSGCFVSACDAISLPDSAPTSTNVYHVTVTNNQINHVQGGITANIGGGVSTNSPRTSFVITGNSIGNPTTGAQGNAIHINSATLGTQKPQTCVDISGNTMTGAWGVGLNNDSLRLRHRGDPGSPNPATFRVRNWDGLNGATPGLESFLETTNIFGAGTVDGFGFQLVGANVFTGGAAACPQ